MPASTGSKLALLTSSLIAGGTVTYIHYRQYDDRIQLRKGINLEAENREERKRLNLIKLQEQADLEKAYRKAQRNE